MNKQEEFYNEALAYNTDKVKQLLQLQEVNPAEDQ